MESVELLQSDMAAAAAEEQLRLGLLGPATQAALTALQKCNDPSALGRGYSVIIQAEFQLNRLTNLEQTLQQCGHQIQQLPVQVVLLWGVVAVELQEADIARATLGKYLAAMQNVPQGMSREDAMAISRLYAVQLLANLCQDFLAAATWLEAGGAGLSLEQQELLLLEVEEAEELLQEQHLAEWASTHAAAATDGGAEHPGGADLSDTPASRDAHSIAPCTATSPVSFTSSAAAILQNGVSPLVDSAMGSLDLGPSASGVSWESMDQQQPQHVVPSHPLPPPQQQQQELQQATSPRHTPAELLPPQPLPPQQQEQHPEEDVRQQAKAVAEVVAFGQQGNNLFCTITGLLETLDEVEEPGSTVEAVQQQRQEQQQQQSPRTAGTTGVIPSLEKGHSMDSTSISNLPDGRDQMGGGSSLSKAAGSSSVNAGSTAAVPGERADQPAAAAGSTNFGAADVTEQQSWAQWMSSSGSRLWSSTAVQGALHALNMQDLQPYEVVGGAALAALIGYSVYRERKALRRAAGNLAAGVAQTAQMALGFSVVNPMAAVPQTQYLR